MMHGKRTRGLEFELPATAENIFCVFALGVVEKKSSTDIDHGSERLLVPTLKIRR